MTLPDKLEHFDFANMNALGFMVEGHGFEIVAKTFGTSMMGFRESEEYAAALAERIVAGYNALPLLETYESREKALEARVALLANLLRRVCEEPMFFCNTSFGMTGANIEFTDEGRSLMDDIEKALAQDTPASESKREEQS